MSIRSGSPSTLQIKGPPRLVKEVKKEWDRLSRDIKTEILDTKLSEPLRPDLYRSLSLATDAYIAPNEKRGKQIQVSHRSEQSIPVRRAEAGLRQLRLQVCAGVFENYLDSLLYHITRLSHQFCQMHHDLVSLMLKTTITSTCR